METICWPVLTVSHVKTNDFVSFWTNFYSDEEYPEAFYQNNIDKPLDEKQIAKWFEWKNRTTLSLRKKKSILRYSSPMERIGANANDASIAEFLNRDGGAIWRIFWLHLQHPKRFPIYDQHVHRAMAFLLKLPDPEIPVGNPMKVQTYLKDYCPFFDRFSDCQRRQVDRALWAFGRFLGTDYHNMIPPSQLPAPGK